MSTLKCMQTMSNTSSLGYQKKEENEGGYKEFTDVAGMVQGTFPLHKEMVLAPT